MLYGILGLLFIIFLFILINLSSSDSKNSSWPFESEKERVGRKAELVATNIISKILRSDDFLFTNIEVCYEDKVAELDNVIINKYGVFIIEVKYYKGVLYGTEEDYEWEKYKDDGYGNTFAKKVKNPIKQVKRQTYILAKYLEYYGARVWVDGYAFLLNGNSPVSSPYMLESIKDIDNAIHTPGRQRLNEKTIESIKHLLDV